MGKSNRIKQSPDDIENQKNETRNEKQSKNNTQDYKIKWISLNSSQYVWSSPNTWSAK